MNCEFTCPHCMYTGYVQAIRKNATVSEIIKNVDSDGNIESHDVTVLDFDETVYQCANCGHKINPVFLNEM